jgi:hypothetical protein
MARFQMNLASVLLAGAGIFGTGAADAATVAYYQWENGMAGERAHGEGAILDSSGNGLDGWASGGLKYEAVSNPDSTLAMHFDGKTGRVWIPDNPLLQLTQSLTLEAYVYLRDRLRQDCIIVGRADDRYGYNPYFLSTGSDGHLHFLIQQTLDTYAYVASPPLPREQWIHVAGTLDDATGFMGLYINGSLVASTTTDVRPREKLLKHHHAGIAIGAAIKGRPDDSHCQGSIDDTRISDVALDPSQFLPPP